MTAAMLCLALAVLLLPGAGARRRLRGLFSIDGARKPDYSNVVRFSVVVGVVSTVLLDAGTFLATALLAGTVGLRRRRARGDRHRAAECAHLLDALEAVIGELRVGAHPSAAADVAARESRGAAARAFAVSAARSKLGGSAADGLRDSDAVIGTELARIADAWRIAEDHGLALAELLTAARADLRGRIRFRARATAALAGARATATVLATLPLLGLALGQLMGADPLRVLFASPAGSLLLPLGVGLACAGLLWSDAITRKVLV
ncbi:type II secretion system F family protein [Nocardia amikacinitolerans]|uniref:type II secretion system F family protein n=1 Tax=Nocardia amikacinitolerans TaxID=756689 RepID=UPI0020A5CEAE|nr:type II secretion system F family protein [Nocardia amikacinitolerans]MCP2278219.1 tight adherence protein B [Nocardia amikacinitolerans]MCP2299216.1 tight adherence protein B [Nocardia amikacinitolerans]